MGFWDIINKSDTKVTDLGNDTYVVEGGKGDMPFAGVIGAIALPILMVMFGWNLFTHLVVDPIKERSTDWAGNPGQIVECGTTKDQYSAELKVDPEGKTLWVSSRVSGQAARPLRGDQQRILFTLDPSSFQQMVDPDTGAVFTYNNSNRTMTATQLPVNAAYTTGQHTWSDCRVRYYNR
jgi:hypothetical protein